MSLMWKHSLVGLGTLGILGAQTAAMFLHHDQLESWPLWSLSLIGFVWLTTFAGALQLLFTHDHQWA